MEDDECQAFDDRDMSSQHCCQGDSRVDMASRDVSCDVHCKNDVGPWGLGISHLWFLRASLLCFISHVRHI